MEWLKRPALWLVVGLALILSACTSTRQFAQVTSLDAGDDGLRILLMPLDVELSSLQASGMLEPNAEWTATAKELLLESIMEFQAGRAATVIPVDSAAFTGRDAALVQVQRLHGAVGQTILLHKFTAVKLPTKKDKFDWTLGPGTAALADEYGTDYALFIHVRDSYTSGGRFALQLAAGLMGVGLSGGEQVGFASLVELKSGKVVWFNFLHDETGDLRTRKGAERTVANLLGKMPQ